MRRITLISAALAAFLPACIQEADDPEYERDPYEDRDNGGGGSSSSPDADGDGWTVAEGDCDDGWDGNHPGAAEYHDGVDQDCDGIVDEGCTSEDGWNQKCDGGYSTDNDRDGYSEAQGDCDDGWDGTNPGHNDEWYDGEDNDCDGLEDEGCESDDNWDEYCD